VNTEILGSVACIMKADNLDETLDLINSISYGQAAFVFTSSGKWAREFDNNVGLGDVRINTGLAVLVGFL